MLMNDSLSTVLDVLHIPLNISGSRSILQELKGGIRQTEIRRIDLACKIMQVFI